MQSKAATVAEYLQELPADRRAALEAVRKVILKNLDKGYQERMGYGMIGYSVPHSIYPAGYHCDPKQPLPFACVASQKNHMAVYMMALYADTVTEKWFRAEWDNAVKAGRAKKLDMGKSCIRFRKIEDVALDVIGEAIRRVPVRELIAFYEHALVSNRKEAAERKTARSAAKSGSKSSPKRRVSGAKKKTARRAAR